MKKNYQSPITNMLSIKVDSQLLGVSNVTTTDPTEGGDPTGGNGNTPNPFGAKSGQFDLEEEDEEEGDLKMWE